MEKQPDKLKKKTLAEIGKAKKKREERRGLFIFALFKDRKSKFAKREKTTCYRGSVQMDYLNNSNYT